MRSERNLATDAVPHSAHSENPALAMCHFALAGCERRLKKALERIATIHLRKPPTHAIGVLLIHRPPITGIAFPKQTRKDLGND